VTGINVHGNVG
jgi:hypothetical protein